MAAKGKGRPMATILVVDDRPTNREWLVGLLGSAGHRLLAAADGAAALAIARAEQPDLIIADAHMPTVAGSDLVQQLQSDPAGASTPVVFGVAAGREPDHFFAQSPNLLCIVGFDGRIRRANPAWETILGFAPAELVGKSLFTTIHPDDHEAVEADLRQGAAGQATISLESRCVCQDGSHKWVLWKLTPCRDDGCFYATGQDVTGRKQMEEQFRQAQKMEAVGRLAGGMAHDFNNLLTVINGYSQIMLGLLRKDDPLRHHLVEVVAAGDRAAALTRQLLAFSRKEVLIPVTVELNALVMDLERMLGRLLGEDVQLGTQLDPNLWPVRADTSQLEQVIMNLAVNARDAMPRGGKLAIETHNVTLEAGHRSLRGPAKPGDYVLVTVADSGSGMDAATKARLFEPFFTTKGPGQGTGLGLATVYGIVERSGGFIDVESELGRGTTFRIYLPRDRGKPAPGTSPAPPTRRTRGMETVLLVEDEDAVRAFTRIVLQNHGYAVLEARHAGEALLLCEERREPIHLLLTDVVMPDMSGRQLAERLSKLQPGMKVLYVSGYTDDAIVRHGVVRDGLPFLPKPFAPEALARKVREVLDQSAREKK